MCSASAAAALSSALRYEIYDDYERSNRALMAGQGRAGGGFACALNDTCHNHRARTDGVLLGIGLCPWAERIFMLYISALNTQRAGNEHAWT